MSKPALASSALVIGLVAAGALSFVAQAGFSRVVLQDQPLSVAGRHAVTARADFGPGAAAGRHAHPGEELGYILEGTVELSVQGRPTVTLKPGDVFYIPSGVPHDGRNPGATKAALLSTFVAEQGKPLSTPVP
jgi:quercetin dioxygenase-like cupin family protein